MAGRLGKVYTHIDCFIFITHVEIHILVLAHMLNSLVRVSRREIKMNFVIMGEITKGINVNQLLSQITLNELP